MSLSDEELVYLILCGNELAFDELYSIYFRLAWKIARDIVPSENPLIDIDDLILDSLIMFMELIFQYRSDCNASFRTYIKICIRNRMYSSLKRQYKLIHKNKAVISLDDIIEDNHAISELYFPVPQEEQPDFHMMIEESVKEYQNYSLKVLTPREKSVYKYLCMGYSTRDIAGILNISLKSCYNTAYRISKKLRNFNMTLTR